MIRFPVFWLLGGHHFFRALLFNDDKQMQPSSLVEDFDCYVRSEQLAFAGASSTFQNASAGGIPGSWLESRLNQKVDGSKREKSRAYYIIQVHPALLRRSHHLCARVICAAHAPGASSNVKEHAFSHELMTSPADCERDSFYCVCICV